MQKPLTDVDVVDSYARPLDDQVKIVLSVPGDVALDDVEGLALRLQQAEGGGFKVPAIASRVGERWRVEALAPAAQLTPGLWKLRLRVGPGELLPLAAWLSQSDRAPLALLPGGRPDTRMPAPMPAPVS